MAPSRTCPAAPVVLKVNEFDAVTIRLPASIVLLPACRSTSGAEIEVDPRLSAAPASTSIELLALILLLLVIAAPDTTLKLFQFPELFRLKAPAVMSTTLALDEPLVVKFKLPVFTLMGLGPTKLPILPLPACKLTVVALTVPADWLIEPVPSATMLTAFAVPAPAPMFAPSKIFPLLPPFKLMTP